MGVLKFLLTDPLPPGAESALAHLRFVAGYDRTPFPTEQRRSGPHLEISHDLSESGYISVPWPIDGVGFPVTVSATLRERPEPYRLLIELARGKLNQVRNSLEDWKLGGLVAPAEIVATLQQATKSFVHAVVDPEANDSDPAAADALRQAYAVSEQLSAFFIASSGRLQQARIGRPATRCTCQITKPLSTDEAELYLAAFEVVQFVPRWSEIEPAPTKYDWSAADTVIDWGVGQGRPVIVGPLIDLSSDALPAWLNANDGDVSTLAAYFCDFVETTVLRYRDRVRDWILCTGFNFTDLHGLNQDDRLRLVVRILEAARGADSDGRWVVGVNQPWGDYLDRAEHTLSPLVFCDTLLRSGLSIAGFNLEIIAGPGDRSSELHDGLELLRLFELYGLLGVPLDITASHPGGSDATANKPCNSSHKSFGSDDAQAEWGGFLASLSSTLSHVRCFAWTPWSNDDNGLIASDGQAKPLLFRLRHLRNGFSA